jgi:hypothetical protein
VVSKAPLFEIFQMKAYRKTAYLPDKETEDSLYGEAGSFDGKLSSCMFSFVAPVENCPPNLSRLPLEEQWDFIAASLRSWAPE